MQKSMTQIRFQIQVTKNYKIVKNKLNKAYQFESQQDSLPLLGLYRTSVLA